jgi:thiamine transport system substrate-binding protein
MEYLLSEEAQAVLPLTQYMYPVNAATPLPASYSIALRPAKTLTIDPSGLADDAEAAAGILAAK